MQPRKKIQTLIFGMSVLALAACSTTGTNKGGLGVSTYADNGSGVSTSGMGDDTGIIGSGSNTIPGANQKYYFDFDKSDVHQSDMPSVMAQAHYLMSHPSAHIRIEGNTDSRGSREYNIALGERRAVSVANILELQGVGKNQITVISFGDEKPVALGNDESDFAQNRRDDLIYEAH